MKKMRVWILVLAISGWISAGLAGELEQIDAGAWVSATTGPGQMFDEEISVWIDIKVPNWSYDKYVGVVWTADEWESWDIAVAGYEFTRWDGYEQWGVDIVPAGVLGNSYIGPGAWNGRSLLGPGHQVAAVDYAIFYTTPWGYTEWDSHGGEDYRIVVAERW